MLDIFHCHCHHLLGSVLQDHFSYRFYLMPNASLDRKLIQLLEITKSMNKKTLGNDAFRKGNFHEAVAFYREYTEQDNSDNKLAFSNMALCYHKLAEYQMAIQACDQALALDEEFAKAYYRRIQARKELAKKGGESQGIMNYQIFQDCQSFVKLCDPVKEANQIEQFKKLGEQFKNKLMLTAPETNHSFFSNILQVQKDNIDVLAISWLEDRTSNYSDQKLKDEDDEIKSLRAGRTNVNEKYKQIVANKTDESDRLIKDISRENNRIIAIKKQIEINTVAKKSTTGNNNSNEATKNEQILKEESPLQQSKEEQATQPTQNQAKQQQSVQQQQLENSLIPFEKTEEEKETFVKDQTEPEESQSQQKQNEDMRLPQKIEVEQKQQTIKTSEETSEEKVEDLYKKWFIFVNSRDIFDDFIKAVLKILKDPKIPSKKKQELLMFAKDRFHQFKLTIKSTPAAVRSEITQLLLQIGASEETINAYSKK